MCSAREGDPRDDTWGVGISLEEENQGTYTAKGPAGRNPLFKCWNQKKDNGWGRMYLLGRARRLPLKPTQTEAKQQQKPAAIAHFHEHR